jgi:hypothetical protein
MIPLPPQFPPPPHTHTRPFFLFHPPPTSTSRVCVCCVVCLSCACQGALLSMAMVLQQESEARTPKVAEFRTKLTAVSTEKHHSTMAKMGGILAQGLLDAGGRNVALSLRSRAGFVKSSAVVGMAMFLQHWYWYPYLHFVSLALAPAVIIGVNRDLAVPVDFSVTCVAKPSDFAYVRGVARRGAGGRGGVGATAGSPCLRSPVPIACGWGAV